MSTPLEAILLFTCLIAKQNITSEAVCPACGERLLLIKWGFYTRYLFDDEDTIKIQRLRCLNRQCSRSTFNLLPHPLLPVLRVPLCFLLALLKRHQQEDFSVAELHRETGKTWPVINRCLAMAKRIQSFVQTEAQTILGIASPCLQPAATWTTFTHAFSYAFFPQCLKKSAPT